MAMRISWATTLGLVCVLLVGTVAVIWWLSSRISSERDVWLAEWIAEGKRAAARSEIDGDLSGKRIPAQTMACGSKDWIVVLAGRGCFESNVIHVRSSQHGGEARLRPSRGSGYRWQGKFHRDIDMALSSRQSAQFRELATRALALPDAYTTGCTAIPCTKSGLAACVDGEWRAAYGPPERAEVTREREGPGDALWPEALAILQVEVALDEEDFVLCY